MGSDRLAREIRRGLLTLLILELLSREGAMHGYGLRKAILARTGWEPAESSLYEALRRLEKAGLVVSEWARGPGGLRKLYRPGPGAREALERLRAEARRLLAPIICESV